MVSPKQILELDRPLQKEFNGVYRAAQKSRDMYVNSLSSELRVDNDAVHFPWTYPSLAFEEKQLGEGITYKDLAMQDVLIKIKKWSSGAKIQTMNFFNAFNKDMLMNEVQGMAVEAAHVPLRRMVNALENGDTDPYYTLYDGDQYFSATHAVGITGTTWSNLKSGALTATTLKEALNVLQTVPLGPNGENLPMNGAQYHLIVHPDGQYNAMELINNTMNPAATFNTENILKGVATLHVEGLLTDVDDWYLVSVLPSKKPFITLKHAILDKPALSTPSMEDESVKQFDELRWDSKRFLELFPTHPYFAVKYVAP